MADTNKSKQDQIKHVSKYKLQNSVCETKTHHIQIEGWLFKKSRVLKQMRKRWIVLMGNTIYSYKHKQQYNEIPTEVISTHHITSISVPKHHSNGYYFDVGMDNKITFTFCAETKQHHALWLNELYKLIDINRCMVITKQHKNGTILSFGCQHFRRNCSYLCSCCNHWYFCSYCHDASECVFTTINGVVNAGHELERCNIIAMKCCNCGKEQKPNELCVECKIVMAKYYCKICVFWDDDRRHSLYHCDKCGVCRYGKKEDFVHCDKCNVCLHKKFYKEHTKCMEESTKCDCPICGDYLHVTDSPVTFWNGCGHAIHVQCMEEFLVYDTLCPICREPWKP
eukprot:392690_1